MRGVWDGEAESRMVADEIERWVKTKRRYRECAILVRASFQMRAFEERFVMLQIPYQVIGGPRFFERAEIRDAHAYLRLIQSEDDDLAFERIVNVPKRGIGDTTVQKLHQLAAVHPAQLYDDGPLFDHATGEIEPTSPATHFRSLSQAAREIVRTDELAARTRTSLANFLRDLDRWRAAAATVPHPRLLETILEESGYTDALRLDKGPTSQTRLDNLKELVQSMGSFDTLQAYLEHVSLVMDLTTCATAERELGADHDPAFGQGAGVPAGVSARLGGRRVPQPAQHGRERRQGARGGAPARLRRHHPGPRRGAHLVRRQPPGSTWPLDQTSCSSRFVDEDASGQRARRRRRPATTAAAPACARPTRAGTSTPARSAPGLRRRAGAAPRTATTAAARPA